MPEPTSMLHLSAMTAGDDGLLKYQRVAAAVRGQIADGTLRPGQPAPSGAELSRLTGYSTLTCRRALRELIADGVLSPGPSRNARPRVAGVPQPPAERTLAAASRALSAGLAARRRANGLTQPELAGLVGISVTTIGHAETGRLWQSRQFWVRADAVLRADGSLLRLHDAFRVAGAGAERGLRQREQQEQEAAELAPAAGEPAPPPGASLPGESGPRARGQVAPARVTIVWGDGTVTTVHPPESARPQVPQQQAAQPETSRGGVLPG
jgi:transcriptional regulator with XRE-family HTH domain